MLQKATTVHTTSRRRAGSALCQVVLAAHELKHSARSSASTRDLSSQASASTSKSHEVPSPPTVTIGRLQRCASSGLMNQSRVGLRSYSTTVELPAESEGRLVVPVPTPQPASRVPLAAKSWVHRLRDVTKTEDYAFILQTVNLFRKAERNPTVSEYNEAIESLMTQTRGPTHDILIIYNEMVTRGLIPNVRTYSLVIRVLVDREDNIRAMARELEADVFFPDGAPKARMEKWENENNFNSAMKLFEALVAITPATSNSINTMTYSDLISLCAHTANVEAAIHVFALLEQRKDALPTPAVYHHLIRVYIAANDLEGAKEVFAEYRRAARERRIVNWPDQPEKSAVAHCRVWDSMVSAYFKAGNPSGALALVEQMMDSASPNNRGRDFYAAGQIPCPSPHTFQTIIEGFADLGQLVTALTWFDRLCAQKTPATRLSLPSVVPNRPHQFTWISLLIHTAKAGAMTDLQRLVERFTKLCVSGETRMTYGVMSHVYKAAFDSLASREHTDAEGIALLDFLVQHLLDAPTPNLKPTQTAFVVEKIVSGYMSFRAPGKAITILDYFVRSNSDSEGAHPAVVQTLDTLAPRILVRQPDTPALTWEETLQLMRACDRVKVSNETYDLVQAVYLEQYAKAKREGVNIAVMERRDWETLVWAAVSRAHTAEQPAGMDLFNVLSEALYSRTQMRLFRHPDDVAKLRSAILLRIEGEQLDQIIRQVPPHFAASLANSASTALDGIALPETEAGTNAVHPNLLYTRLVDALLFPGPKYNPELAYSRFHKGKELGLYPVIGTVGRLVEALGREKMTDKAKELYIQAQSMIAAMPTRSRVQALAWFGVENRMLAAMAHCGDYAAADSHHKRIIGQGGRPTTNSYGSLIYAVLERENGTVLAQALFEEAKTLGVRLTAYVYTNLISKQARARKPKEAAAAFAEMRQLNVNPGPVTFTALILAHALTGNAKEAELVFTDMLEQKLTHRHKPESPYNIMMQLYTTLQPDRERALHYFNALREADIKPSAQTYKLLLDAHSVIAPPDMESTVAAFRNLEADTDVTVDGSHWASLIRGWGCFSDDFEKGMDIVKAMAEHPETEKLSKRSLGHALDAELEVLVAHKRVDLVDAFLEKQHLAGIPLSSYGATVLVMGYADAGELEKARGLFESLQDVQVQDTPENHVLRKVSPDLDLESPVYRRASTWDAMIRAELTSGNREQAEELVRKLEARNFPTDIFTSIKGLLDLKSVTSWNPDHWRTIEATSEPSATEQDVEAPLLEEEVEVEEETQAENMLPAKSTKSSLGTGIDPTVGPPTPISETSVDDVTSSPVEQAPAFEPVPPSPSAESNDPTVGLPTPISETPASEAVKEGDSSDAPKSS